jgi:NAD(P)-dependent dehydrogenase (short-subunit alcohol dehydrogenase family)
MTGGSLGRHDPAVAELPFRLDRQTAWVIGGDSKMRDAVVAALSAAGASIARSPAGRAPGSGIEPVLAEIGDAGALDIFVNLMGFDRGSAVGNVSEDELDAAIEDVVEASFLLSQAAASKMRSTKSIASLSSIVHVATPLARVGAADRSVCCMAMHALRGLTMASAVELGPMGIRVNMIEAAVDDNRERALSHAVTVDAVAASIVYLCSSAGAATTGSSLLLDAGWTAR